MLFFLSTIFGIGTIFGSFSTVLIERWHNKKGGIINGRSECPKCKHILASKDLIPIFSYIFHRGKCSYCREKISIFYPTAEIVMGSIFLLLAYSALKLGIEPASMEFIFLIGMGFVTGIYILYDIRYMEIPDEALVPSLYILLLIPFFSILFFGYSEYTFHTFHISLWERLTGGIILYTFFYIQIFIPGGYYLLRNNDWKNFRSLLFGYITFPISILIDFIRKSPTDEETLNIPTWIGGGDLRIALFIGLTLGITHGITSFVFAYVVGSIVGIFILLLSWIQGKKSISQIPFGPFLGLGWLLSIVFFPEIKNFYEILIQ